MKKILVIGSLNLDMVIKVEHMPHVGETILGEQVDMVPGGKGANQACAVGRLGGNVSMLGAVGDDTYADIERKSLAESGVDISHIIEIKENMTGLAVVSVDRNGDNSIIVSPGANAALMPEDIDRNRELMEESDIVIFQLEIPLQTVCYAAKLAKSLGKTVILDPAPVPEEFPEELYRYIDVIKPNETELSMLTGIADVEEHLEEAVRILRNKGVKNVIVTLGEKGVCLCTEAEGFCRIDAVRVKAVDTTAAGDSFTAAMALMLTQGHTLKEAVEFANVVSSIVVTRKGAQSSIPSYEEVERHILVSEAV